MKELPLHEIKQALTDEILMVKNINKIDLEQTMVTGISTDTRTINSGEIFVAIPGEKFDGHSFLKEAQKKGAVGFVVQYIPDDYKLKKTGLPVIKVDNSITALQKLANYYCNLFSDLTVIGITGSAGKTTTKDFLASILGQEYNVLKTKGNLNNHIGLPLTLLSLSGQEDFAVVEMGMSARGEIRTLSEVAEPEVGIITNVGPAHLENLGSVANVAQAKSELIQELPLKGKAILNYDDKYVRPMKEKFKGDQLFYFSLDDKRADIIAREIQKTNQPDGIEFKVDYNQRELNICLHKPGRHNVYNVLPGILCGLEWGLSENQIQQGILSCDFSSLRMEFIEKGNYTIINDTYNANPLSLKSALDVLIDRNEKRKIAVVGDMLELGDTKKRAHREIGEYIANNEIDYLLTVGKLMGLAAEKAKQEGMSESKVFSFSSKKMCGKKLKDLICPGTVILLKGSRGQKMEKIVDLIDDQEDEE